MTELREEGIGSQVHYIPIYRQPYYKNLLNIDPKQYPITESFYDKALSLPLYPSLANEDVERVIARVLAVCKP